MRDVIAGSTAGMRPRPNLAASCMAPRNQPSKLGWDQLLVSSQHVYISPRYSSAGRTVKAVGAGLHLKKALTGAGPGDTSSCKCQGHG